ncbi:MAG: metallophosphoesterase [Candidatus Kapabacteria bacterium]|nr:metallophosphoesterase [Candidatus Kapabacteria bacterium]
MLLFGATLATVFLLLDLYVLSHWTSFARKRNLNRWWYRVPFVVAVVVFGLLVTMLLRRHFFRMDGFDVTLLGLVSLWYLPKFGIAFILLVRDAFRLGQNLLGRIRKQPARQTIAVQNRSQIAIASADKAVDETTASTQQRSRREFLGTAAWSMSAVPFVLVGRGMWSTLYDFQTYRVDLVIDRLPRAMDGMRIAQISDIHAGSFPDHRPFQEVRRILESERPDAIVITGDFVNQKPHELKLIAGELERLRAPHGVLASLGNHDHYNTPEEHADLVRGIRAMGVDLLVNSHRRIGNGSASIVVAGTDNTGFRQTFARLGTALDGVGPEDPVILLAHDPTFWDKEVVGQAQVDVMLSGHTHGGQFGVQFLGLEWSPAQHIYKQWAGLYTKGPQQLYVNRGIGTVGPPLRIGIPPEITVFTLRSAPVDKGLA